MVGVNGEQCVVDLADRPLARVIDLDAVGENSDEVAGRAAIHPGILVGIGRAPLSPGARRLAGALTTSLVASDEGPVGVVVDDVHAAAEEVLGRVSAVPHASHVLSQVLQFVGAWPVDAGLWVESLAYSTLLGGEEFRAWRSSMPANQRGPSKNAVRVDRDGDVLQVVLDRPDRRNALDAAARVALSDALDVAIADPSVQVELRGEGMSFCSGGDLDEFGTATDLALAHLLRLEYGPSLRLARVADRTTAFVHGACVGAGVELPAFATRVVAAPGTTFRLPEVSMGLIPGAGGTVSVTRRIGRWRAAWLMMSGATLELDRATTWGLVDRVD